MSFSCPLHSRSSVPLVLVPAESAVEPFPIRPGALVLEISRHLSCFRKQKRLFHLRRQVDSNACLTSTEIAYDNSKHIQFGGGCTADIRQVMLSDTVRPIASLTQNRMRSGTAPVSNTRPTRGIPENVYPVHTEIDSRCS